MQNSKVLFGFNGTTCLNFKILPEGVLERFLQESWGSWKEDGRKMCIPSYFRGLHGIYYVNREIILRSSRKNPDLVELLIKKGVLERFLQESWCHSRTPSEKIPENNWNLDLGGPGMQLF